MMIELLTLDEGQNRAERADAAANRVTILQTAEKLFAKHGVPNVNMADIATAAGVGKGTLYRRFANKGELCLALMDTQLRDFQNRMLDTMRQMHADGVPYLDQLDVFLVELVQFNGRHLPLLGEVQRQSDLLDQGDLIRPHYWQYMTVRALLDAAQRQNEVPDSLDVDYMAEALLAPLTPSSFRFQQRALGFSLERITAGLCTLIKGLRSLT